MPHTVQISPGELVDRITIAGIKTQRLPGTDQRARASRDLQLLRASWSEVAYPQTTLEAVDALEAQLLAINQQLWMIEDEVRECERQQRFDAHFVELARSVYLRNDERAALKREIDRVTGSDLWEQKSYAGHERA